MISGQDWSDSETWWGLALAVLLVGVTTYCLIFFT
jgi:hypothetical protein